MAFGLCTTTEWEPVTFLWLNRWAKGLRFQLVWVDNNAETASTAVMFGDTTCFFEYFLVHFISED